MQKISRFHLANCGFRSAWYEAVTFDLSDPTTGMPTDTVINLENGGGKTTLLGLVFSCFETSQDRFLKHIQSKNNSFSQYFTHDGVPGFIVVEWLMPARTAGGTPYRLVTGQAVAVRTTTETEVDRLFFSFEERDDLRLETLPMPGQAGPAPLSMGDFSRWIYGQQRIHADVFISHNRQAEWQRHLKDERLIDLDMLRMQVNFSAQEGGFDTGFLDFKTEAEFLRKFLALTSDTAKAEEARRSVVSVCELHRRKPQFQRRRDQLKKFRVSLTTFAEAARQYLEAVSTQQSLLIAGAQLVRALQARAQALRAAQAAEVVYEKEQRIQAGGAAKDAALFQTAWLTGTWVWHQQRVGQAKALKDEADKQVTQRENRAKLLRAARLQQEILSIDERLKELAVLAAAETAQLKPALDQVEGHGALLRRALFNEETRLKEVLEALERSSTERAARDKQLRLQKTQAENDELRLAREQTSLQTAENLRAARWQALRQEGVFDRDDEQVSEAVARHEAAAESARQAREIQAGARNQARRQAEQHRHDAGVEKAKAAGLNEQVKGLRAFIGKGEAELERLGQLPALLNAVESPQVDPRSPALPQRLQEVISDANRQKSLADVRLAELRATRQSIEDTGVAGQSHDVTLVVQLLQAAGVRSAVPFNEYISRTLEDAAAAQALVLSDPARYAGVCVAKADLPKAAALAWTARRPSRPVMVSAASLDAQDFPADRLVVPPEDASAFNIAAASRLADNLDARLKEESSHRSAYEQRYEQTLRAAQELETFAATYGQGQLAQAAADLAAHEAEGQACRSRAASLETQATELDAQAVRHDSAAGEQETLRQGCTQAAQAARRFEAEHEAGRAGRLARLTELGQELIVAQESKAELELALAELLEAQKGEQTLQLTTDMELRLAGEERGRIAYYARDYPAQEQLLANPRSLQTLRDVYKDSLDNYQTEERLRLGSLSERINGVKNQRTSKAQEFTRDFSGVNMTELKPYLGLVYEEELRNNEQGLVQARKDQLGASTQHETLSMEARKWHGLNKTGIGSASSEFEGHSLAHLETLIETYRRQVDAANERMRAANEEASKAQGRAQAKEQAAELDEQNEAILRGGMGLPEQPDPALLAAEIGALVGQMPEVPDAANLVLAPQSGGQVSTLLTDFSGKNAGVAKRQTAARGTFDALKTAASEPQFREGDPDVATQMAQNDFTAACTDAPRLLEHLDDRIATTESTLSGMQADFDTCVEEVLGVVRGAITTLNKACSPEKSVPANAPYVGGKQVLKMRANFGAVTSDMRRAALRNYLDVLADTMTIPAKGTDLISDAVARVYGKPLGIQVLKMSIEESEQYVPVERISNSGGEGVVMAMFLYLVINQLRAENHAQVQKQAGGPLILDNPFAKATTGALWRAQRLLASAMNVQLIFATALQDFNAIGEFQRFIRLRKAGQNTKTKRWHLEVARLQLTDPAEEVEA